ncbi:MAG TPA: VWA domain-containing protein [Burkholderiaceae bacterium]|nr:VWA domain-containing protein [Burkholderiaceae bacterium]
MHAKPKAGGRPLLFEQAEAQLAALDNLPRTLWLAGLTNSQGPVEPRLATLLELLTALVAASLPPASTWHWPSARLAEGLARAIAALELPRYCAQRPDLADTVLRSLLFHTDLVVDYMDRGATSAAAIAMVVEAFAADWKQRRGEIDELIDVFGDLPKNTRWDLLRGLLAGSSWQEVVRIRRLLERLPELAHVVRALGRVHATEEPDPASRQAVPAFEPRDAPVRRTRTIRIPHLPGATRGIFRSDRVARMLPAEATLLGHPRLRLVWHARRAERTLLTYEDDDRMQEEVLETAPTLQASAKQEPQRRREMGPMIVCVDTSGSMQGGAEAVAKATVLEAVRTAHAQQRACHLFAFSGPDEILELRPGLDVQGIEDLAGFLGQSFRGGTDVCGPLARSLDLLQDEDLRFADLLIASDGEFGATRDLAQRLRECKVEQGLRVQGILIGDRETIGLLELADDIFWVRDWRRFGTSQADSPVHSKSLTALYFPGALRTPENRARTVSGAEASAAMRSGQNDFGAHASAPGAGSDEPDA